jgi:hypothetical protein
MLHTKKHNILEIKSVHNPRWEDSEVPTEFYPVTENNSVGTCTPPIHLRMSKHSVSEIFSSL